jgi:hypothetical protein
MPDSQSALAALQHRVAQAGRTPTSILDAEVLRAAHALAKAAETEIDTKATRALGWYCWQRYLALPENHGQDELAAAVGYLTPTYLTDPAAVPERLHRACVRRAASAPAAGADPSALYDRAVDEFVAYKRAGRRSLLDRAVLLFRAALTATPLGRPARAESLHNLGIVLQELYAAGGDAGALEEAVQAGRDAVALTPQGHPDRVGHLSGLGNGLQALFKHTPQTGVLREAVRIEREAFALTPPDDPNHMAHLNNLRVSLQILFERSGELSLLEEAVQAVRDAVAASPRDHPGHVVLAGNLAGLLYMLYEQTQSLSVVQEAVRAGEEAVGLTAHDHPNRAMCLSNLAAALSGLYERSGQVGTLQDAVRADREAVALTRREHPNRAQYLSNLGHHLRALFERTGDVRVLEEAVQAGREAVALTPHGGPERARRLTNLGNSLKTLSARRGDVRVLKEAVRVGREAVALTSPDHPDSGGHLTALGNHLQALFDRTGELVVLEEAVRCARGSVVGTRRDHPDIAGHLNNLGNALTRWFEYTGESGALEEAVQACRDAVASTPLDHPGRRIHLNTLANGLLRTFEHTGDLSALAEAIRIGRQAVACTPNDDPARGMILNNLGNSLSRLFEYTGERSALEEAIQTGRYAVAAAPQDDHNRAMYLSSLGTRLQVSFERTGRSSVLEEAVQVGREAVASIPQDHPARAGYLDSLGNGLQALFDRTGQADALEEAVQVGREAVASTSQEGRNRAIGLNNLGNALLRQFRHTGRTSALEEAVQAGRDAISNTPQDHPERAKYLNNLGNRLQVLFEHTGQTGVLNDARRCYHEAADSKAGSTSIRIDAYRSFALLSTGPDEAEEGLRAMEDAIDLVEVLAPGSLARVDREHQLGRLADLAGEAAAAALNAGRPSRAVELLERTRGILAADAVGMQNDDQVRLREFAPHLADELNRLRARLADSDRLQAVSARVQEGPSMREAIRDADRRLASERRAAHAAWQRLLERIRRNPGFEDYLHAPRISRLARQAQHGPVIVISTSPARCDALVLTDVPDNPVQVVPLSGLTHGTARDHVSLLLEARRTTADPHLDPAVRAAAQQEILAILAWLWDVVTEPVLTHLGYSASRGAAEAWPRVWWCPVGLLAFLPLHAAGHHADARNGLADPRIVLDRVVSSYTTTIRGLAHARSGRPATAELRTLIVPAPDIPGAPLHGVSTETASISGLIRNVRVLVDPTRATVLELLPGNQIAHFSCHGYADWADPTRSHLVVTDHAVSPLTIADISALNLTAELAFLSACDTSVTTPRLADESLHITGAFYTAGYRNVIGTLWSVDDRTAAGLAADFYAHLTNDGTTPPETSHSAHSLHSATNRLRAEYPNTPTLWAAYTHTGS